MTDVDWDEARAMWADGFDTKDIAEQFGVQEDYIYKNIDALYGEVMERAA